MEEPRPRCVGGLVVLDVSWGQTQFLETRLWEDSLSVLVWPGPVGTGGGLYTETVTVVSGGGLYTETVTVVTGGGLYTETVTVVPNTVWHWGWSVYRDCHSCHWGWSVYRDCHSCHWGWSVYRDCHSCLQYYFCTPYVW